MHSRAAKQPFCSPTAILEARSSNYLHDYPQRKKRTTRRYFLDVLC